MRWVPAPVIARKKRYERYDEEFSKHNVGHWSVLPVRESWAFVGTADQKLSPPVNGAALNPAFDRP